MDVRQTVPENKIKPKGFDIRKSSPYTMFMFVAVVCDIASEDHRNEVHELLGLYGFKNIVTNVFESTKIQEKTLLRLKRDIDRATDFYDKVRFYQYPLDETLAITFLSQKKWRRTVLKL